MACFAGLRGTGSFGTDERPKNFREMILWLNPNGSAPIFALTSRGRRAEPVNDPEFSWWEEKLSLVRVQVTAGLAAASTAVTLASGGYCLQVGDVLQVEKAEAATIDNEEVKVTAINSDTSIVVQRGVAGTSAAGVGTSTYLTRIGSAFAEGSRAPDPSNANPVKNTNYTEIFKETIGASRTALATRYRTGDSWVNDKKRKAFAHAANIEMRLLYGQAYEDVSGSQPVRYTGGLRQYITTNSKVYTTTPTMGDFTDFLGPIFDAVKDTDAGNERIVFAGNGALGSFNNLVIGANGVRINYDGTVQNAYGMALTRYITPFGTFAIRSHPLLSQHPLYRYSMFIVDPTGIIWRPLTGGDTQFKDNIQLPDEDARRAQWLTEGGFEIQHESTMGYIGNFVVPYPSS